MTSTQSKVLNWVTFDARNKGCSIQQLTKLWEFCAYETLKGMRTLQPMEQLGRLGQLALYSIPKPVADQA